MPQKNGLDFLKELKDQKSEIPFLLFTGKGREEVFVKALNLGVDRYINKNGSPEIVYCELADAINKTVERKKAQDMLRLNEERYRELANSLPDIVFETDTNGMLLYVNDKAFEIAGYSPDELKKGLNIMQFVAPEDEERAKKNIQRLMVGGKYFPDEYTFVRKDGSTFNALITAMPHICNNIITGLRGFVLDIFERKKAERSQQIAANIFE